MLIPTATGTDQRRTTFHARMIRARQVPIIAKYVDRGDLGTSLASSIWVVPSVGVPMPVSYAGDGARAWCPTRAGEPGGTGPSG
jgi:hypothetical protein